jgi:hypothetical protein
VIVCGEPFSPQISQISTDESPEPSLAFNA